MINSFKNTSYLIDKSKTIINDLMLETLIKDLPINMIYDVNFISDDSTSGIINVIVIQRSLNRFLDGSQLLDGQSLLTGNFSH